MLNLNRKLSQSTLLHVPLGMPYAATIEVKVVAIDSGGIVKLGFNAPHEVTIVRPEVNDPDRVDRSTVPPDEIIKKLFHECWQQGHGFATYEKSKWMELQAALRNKGVDV